MTEYDRKKARIKQVAPGVRRVDDPHHPRGYREIRSRAAMRELLNRKILEQNGCCYHCKEKFTDYTIIDPEHLEPKGMNGARHDDSPENIVASCRPCNSEKGSRRDFAK